MADKPVDEVVQVDAALDALSSPTSSDVYETLLPFSNDAVAAVAAKRALGGGGALPDEWTVGDDGSLIVVNDADFAYFKLTPGIVETFVAALRVYNSLTIDDCDLIAKNDNGDIHLRILSSGAGFVRAYKPDHSVYFELDSSAGSVKLNGATLAGFPVTIADGEDVRISAAEDADTVLRFVNESGVLTIIGTDEDGVTRLVITSHGSISVTDADDNLIPLWVPPFSYPVVPATPTAQDIADALVALGLVTQAT